MMGVTLRAGAPSCLVEHTGHIANLTSRTHWPELGAQWEGPGFSRLPGGVWGMHEPLPLPSSSAAGTLSIAQEGGSLEAARCMIRAGPAGGWAVVLGPVWRRIGRPPGSWPVSSPEVTRRKP